MKKKEAEHKIVRQSVGLYQHQIKQITQDAQDTYDDASFSRYLRKIIDFYYGSVYHGYKENRANETA